MRRSVTSSIQEKSGLMFPSNLVLTVCKSWIIGIAALLLLVSGFTQVAQAQARSNSFPTARVQSRVDNTQRALLPGHTLPILRNATDLGRLPAETAMNHLIMVLRASPEQEHGLRTLIDQQLDKKHANFHQWMTPEQFGAHFGVDDSDIAQITNWLRQQGFAVENVAPGKRFIQFSGSVKQVESAFQTEMHSYKVKGETHIANSRDISVPAALKPVILGVPTLHNFFKKADIQDLGTLTGTTYEWAPFTGVMPDYTNGSTHYVGAADFAAIYNTNPLLTAGFDGTGVSIGVIARTDIHLGDVQIYREFFNLKNNDPTFIVAGEDPGIVGGDDTESYLDVEVSGGAAPGASVNFITSRATLTTDGVDLSAMYAVQNNLTDIISESYGQCEANFSTAQAAFYTDMWGQAAAQGQSVFVSSGDNGPAACDLSTNTFSGFGYAVSMLASSPFNVAVGGTLFADTTGGPWWGTTATSMPPFESALGYIPEIPWNEAKGSGAVGAAGLWSGSGGISAYFMTPSWQRGFGVPTSDPPYPNQPTFVDPTSPFVTGPHRYLPDVSMAAAANHDGTLYCAEGICQLSSTNTIVNAGIVGGTSVAAPTMAGVQALIDHVNGGRQGLPTYVYYALADAQHTASLNCSAEAGGAMNPNCAFHDVDTGNNLVCGNSACTAGLKIGWTAAPGYDLASGLGSPNVANLANLWSTVTFNSSVTSLNVAQTTGITHGQAVNVSGSVVPGADGGTPSGNVAFIVSSGALTDPIDPNTGGFANQVALATLDGSGNYNLNLADLPAGTYTLTARYGGDGNFASSLSPSVEVTVTSEDSTLTIVPNALNGTTCVETPQTTFTYGSYVWTDFVVQGGSGQGVPTGTVAVTDGANPLVTTTLNANGIGHMLSGAIPTSFCIYLYTFQDTPPLTVGTHQLGASYSGDSSFNAMTATPVAVTITAATISGSLTSGSSNIGAGGTVRLNFTLAGISSAGPGTLAPTGTVTFTDNTTASTLGTATLSPTATLGGFATLTTTGITANGAHSIQASWPGDLNYNGLTSGAVTVTVQGGTATSVVVTSNTNPSTVGGRPTFTATMTPTTVTSGTVNFYDGSVLLGSGTVGAAHTATFRPAATVNLPAGVRSITAVYAGNATYNSSTSAVFPETFNQTATTISLTVKNAGPDGESFVLSAILGTTVAATPPSGLITFYDGVSSINTAPFTTVTAAQGGYGIWQSQLNPKLSPGVHTITAQLTDPNYTAPTSNSQTVTVGPATAITSANNTTFVVGTNGTFTVTATGSPTPSITEMGTPPSGVSFHDNGNGTGTLGGTPAAGTGGGYSISFTASNGSGSNATQPFTLTVDQAPAITSASGATFVVGTNGTFTVTATGFPTPSIVEMGAPPSGVTFHDNGDGTGTLSGTPAAGTGGGYNITFTASNGVGSNATQPFTLTVGQAPAITSANNTTFVVGTNGTFTVTATGSPTPSITEMGTPPSGVSFHDNGNGTGTLSGTPAAGTGGGYNITFTASNGVGSNATQPFTLTVDQAPTFTSASSATFVVGTNGTVTVTATGFPTPSITKMGALPSGVNFHDNGNGTGALSGTPAAGTGGVYNITFTASNGVGSNATQPFTLTVDQAPTFTSASSATFTIGAPGSFTVMTMAYPAAGITEMGPLPTGLSFHDNGDGTGTLKGTPLIFDGGDFGITVTATNGIGSPATQPFTIIVQQAPAITSANTATFTINTPNSFTVTTTGFPAPSLAKSGGLPPGVTFVDNNNRTATLSGTPSAGGTFPLVFTASNVVSTTQQNFTLNVAGVSISPSPLNFGTAYLGGSTTLSVTLTNMTKSPVTINSVSITPGTANAAAYTAVSHCTSALKTGKSCTIAVTFLANALGLQTATLNVLDSTLASPQEVGLSAYVIDPVAQFNPTTLAFGTQAVNSSTTLPVTLTNTGQTALSIGTISIAGANSGEFSEVNNCPGSLAPTANCTISVTFAPTVKGARTGTLTVTDNVAAGKSTVALTGTGH